MDRRSWSGTTLGGRYRIDELLGQGGMSSVYKAFDPHLKRVVAVKLVHSHLAEDPKFLSRFEEEAAAVARLRHPNIVKVFDFNHDQGLYYMVQEFLAGETLQERLRRLNRVDRKLPLAEAIQFTIDICDAAGYAHQQGMVHRDIKPANIMLENPGQAILMDFGIVKITGSEQHTATGAVIGTALYMPPELIRGEAPDPRSDQYSLGVTLFETVSARPPFQADSAMSLLMMHMHDPVPDLRLLRPDVPEGLVAVIEKSLAKDREKRYRSMAAMAIALKKALDSLPANAVHEATLFDDPPGSAPGPIEAGPPPDFKASTPPREVPARAPSVPAGRPASVRSIHHAPAKASPPNQGSGNQNLGPPQPTPPAAPAAFPASAGRLVERSSDRPVSRPAPVAGVQAGRPRSSPGAAPVPSPAGRVPSPSLWMGSIGLLLLVVLCGAVAVWQVLTGLQNRERATNGPPDMVEATAIQDTGCRSGPAPEFPPVATLAAGQVAQVRGLSPDERWWNVSSPANSEESCWLPKGSVTVEGDISLLPLVEPPPLPAAATKPALLVEITGISDDQNHYRVEYIASGFVEELPGTHIHFFFNTVSPDQVGLDGEGIRLMHGGPSPFTGFHPGDRPAEATELCALVANPDHSVILGSGNCFPLPDAPSP